MFHAPGTSGCLLIRRSRSGEVSINSGRITCHSENVSAYHPSSISLRVSDDPLGLQRGDTIHLRSGVYKPIGGTRAETFEGIVRFTQVD
jgi:hypothetical protein